MSSSDSDGGASPPPAYSQYSQYDGALDLDASRRKNRLANIERRRAERKRQAEERRRQAEERRRQDERRRERKGGKKRDNDDDDGSVSSSGSADLLAGASPLPSPPSSPAPGRGSPSPLRTSRISNRARRGNKIAEEDQNAKKGGDESPSSILKSKKGSSSPNRVAWRFNHQSPEESRPWRPKYDSDSDDNKKWRPKYDSGSDNEKRNTAQEARRTLLNGSKDNANNNAASVAKSSPARKKRAWDDSDSDNGKMPSRSNSQSNSLSTAARKVTEPKAKTGLRARLGTDSDSSSSDDDMEALRRGIREKNKAKAEMAAKKAAKANSPTAKPKMEEISQRPAAASATKRSRAHALALDSSDDDADDFLEVARRRLREKQEAEEAVRRAEREAARRHNPLDLERREREEMEEARVAGDARRKSSPAKVSRTHAGAGGLEGTDIVVGDETEVKSISDMGDSAAKRGISPGGPLPSKPARGRRRGSNNRAEPDSDDEEGESPTKKQRFDPLWNPNQGRRGMESDDDGLWGSSEEEKKAADGSSSDDGAKKKRGRSRQRVKPGSTQARKRSRSDAARAQRIAEGSSGGESDGAPAQRKKPAARKKAPRRRSASDSGDEDDAPKKRSSNGTGRWASLYGAEEVDDGSASEDERERQERKLKPEFANPKLGPPAPLVPFVLSRTWRRGDPLTSQNGGQQAEDGDDDRKPATAPDDDDDADKVPASINRYLQEYQRLGIQFMYSSVSHGKGCVLGDDMGLGKTVQMISLIAALLKKTGTGLDQLAIKKHQAKVLKTLKAQEDRKRQALLDGFGIKNDPALDTDVERPNFTPILVVVPPSVVKNWENEFETWGHFNVGVYQGSSREKALERIKDGRDSILICGKSLFVRASDYDAIASIEWRLVIVDEFHEFKNGKTQGYLRLADLRDNSGCPVIGMTGTLMQNNHDELYYLIDLVRPGLLGDIREFRDEISKPINYARAKDAKDQVTKLAEQQENLLRSLIKPAYIERKKEDVLKDSLTVKKEKVIFCELSELQKKIYRHILTLPDFQLLRFANAPCDCGVNKQYFRGYAKMKTHKEQIQYQRRHKNELIPQKQCCWRYPWNNNRGLPGEPDIDPDAALWSMAHEKPIGNPDDIEEDVIDDKYITCQNCPTCLTFQAMNKLYKISSHPALLQVDPCESGADAKKKLEFAKVALTPDILCELPGGTYYKSDGIMDDHIKLSGKMKTLDYLLRRYLRKRNRVLLFSYSTASLDVIQNHIKTRGWTNLRLDGQTPTSQRQALVDKFQNGDVEIFLISTKAGGLGLNLTEANKVIIFDVNWNPSYDEQAQDRAYRIGQKRDVDTVRLVARGTIEELMYARQVYKVQLKKQTFGHSTDGKNQPKIFRGVAKDKNRKGELFGLENLLKFKDGSFMASLWKKADDTREEHDMNELAKELENMDEDDIADLAEEADEGPKDNRRKSPKKPSGREKQQDSGDEDSDSDGDDDQMGGGIDHGDLFSNTKGGAKVKMEDSDADEEMGGESQIIEVQTKMAVQGMGDGGVSSADDYIDDEAEEDDRQPTPPDYKPRKPAATVTSPVKSATAARGRSGTVDSTPNSLDGPRTQPRTQQDDDTDDDDKTAPLPSPAKESAVGSATNGEGKSEGQPGSNPSAPGSKNAPADADDRSEKLTPDRSVGERSTDSFDALRTQPSTQRKTQRAPGKGGGTAKVCLMGTVFETQKKAKDGPAKKKKGGLYIPSYSKK